jgi:hypothetical protein
MKKNKQIVNQTLVFSVPGHSELACLPAGRQVQDDF